MKLSDARGKSQNLHFVRFLAAIGVIFAHSFVLSTGSEEGEWLNLLTGQQIGLGAVAVAVFFLCGGYLIAKSVERLKTFGAYFKARMIRILPPLIFVTIAVTILGVFFSTYSAKEYFSIAGTWKYLLNGVFVLVHELPGVFTENPYMPTVNGALWTLPVEFACYVACFVLYQFKGTKKKQYLLMCPAALTGFAALWVAGSRIPMFRSMIRPCLLFYIGIGFWVYRDFIELKMKWMILSICGLILTVAFQVSDLGMVLFFPYIMFTIWFGIRQCPEWLGKLGNYSYGMYLWGFPVQQAIVQCAGGKMNPYINTVIAVPIVFLLGILTYNLTEKRIGK